MSHELDLDTAWVTSGPTERSWSVDDTMLYALAVGVGDADLSYTTENTLNVKPQVLPGFATIVGLGEAVKAVPGIDWDLPVLHGEQSVELLWPLRVQGRVVTTDRVVAVADKGSGVAITTEAESVDAATGEVWFKTGGTTFIPGASIDGSHGRASVLDPVPDRPADLRFELTTRSDQALLYRMCGDRNRLHSDPTFAAAAGYERPILHGLCTWGMAGWVLVRELCLGVGARVKAVSARFSGPVYPGDTLAMEVWRGEPGHARFRVFDSSGSTVLDRGELRFDA